MSQVSTGRGNRKTGSRNNNKGKEINGGARERKNRGEGVDSLTHTHTHPIHTMKINVKK